MKIWPVFCAGMIMLGIHNVMAEEYPDINTALEEQEIIRTLENDNRILDSEIERCEKKKKGWTAATVIGGVGVVATGTAAVVQGQKIKQEKAAIQTKQAEYNDLQTKKANIEE